MTPRTHQLAAFVASLCLASASFATHASARTPVSFVAAKNKGVSPTLAAEQRKPVQEQARGLRVSGQHQAAGEYLSGEARRLRDPLLFLDAADAFKQAATESRDVQSAERAAEEARIANDILQFLGDDRASKRWRPVSSDHRQALLSRADTLISTSDALAEEIRAEQAAAVAPPEEEVPEERAKGSGQGMIIGGAALTVVGVGGLALGVAGIAMGASAQKNVNDPIVYGEEFDEYDEKGGRGNTFAFVGLPLAAVGLGAGLALFFLGKKRKQAAGTEEESMARSIRIAPAGRGLSVSGRF